MKIPHDPRAFFFLGLGVIVSRVRGTLGYKIVRKAYSDGGREGRTRRWAAVFTSR